MNTIYSYQPAGQNWQPHASVNLPSEAITTGPLESLLRGLLQPLPLPDGLFEKVLASAIDAAARVPNGVRQVHLMIFTPASQTLANQTWGFFRMVKSGETTDPLSTGTYEIVFYLYAEGSPHLG